MERMLADMIVGMANVKELKRAVRPQVPWGSDAVFLRLGGHGFHPASLHGLCAELDELFLVDDLFQAHERGVTEDIRAVRVLDGVGDFLKHRLQRTNEREFC